MIDGQALRQGRGSGLGRKGAPGVSAALVLALALAGCTQQPGVARTQQAVGVGPATSGAVPRLPQLEVRKIAWPLPAAAAGTGAPAGAPGREGAAAAPATATTAQVTDPFAGQGVARPDIPAAGKGAAAGASAAAPAGGAAGGAASSAPAPATRRHTVVAGETGWSVARRYGVSVQDLARANGLPDTMTLRVGQSLVVPAGGGTASASAVTAAPGTGSPTPTPPSASKPLPAERTEPAAAAATAPRPEAPDLGKTRTAASGSGKLAMPANGAILRPYAKGKNEGIDISAAAGSAISAAGAGTVAAVTRDTEGVPIVVVRHADGLMTVYAGIDKLSVAKGDAVKRGQTIGAARNTGVVHFEVRKGFDSVDPEDYL